jgi:hypothetical protein
MQIIRHITIVFFILASILSYGQNSEAVRNYINAYKDLAIAEMQRTGVPASITLAQGIHESGAGTSNLVQRSNNHFGIKCKANWAGESVQHDDDARGECFRKYPLAEDSYKDHSNFLKNGQRYAFLFQLDPADYQGWAYGLKKAGYATNPKYPAVLIKLVEDYNLQDYTLIALGKMPALNNTVDNPEVITVPEEKKAVPELEKELTIDYPTGQFKINDTKVMYAAKGTSFLHIAKEYNIDLSRLFEFNDMKQMEEVEKDCLIYLQRKRKTGNNEFHIIKPGESLHDIAQLQAIRLESLLEYNWLNPGEVPVPGEQLSLKKKSATIPKLAIKTNYAIVPGVIK